ncbi:MAG: DNA polymerase III subunit beta [Eubacteriales bacterium]|nr:DNA polymerase III subunit beta [Eubacteriales bacterium]
MKLQCSSQELITGLVNATRALSARPATQVLECVKLTTGEDEITLTCTDGSLTIYTRVRAQVDEAGEVLLPGRLFTEIARKLPEGVVSIQMNDKRVTTIRCASSRSTLTGLPVTEFPKTLDLINTHALHVPQKRLKEMISRVVFAIASQESRQTLTGCLMEVTKTELRLVGLDGFRLALQRMHGDFVLPEGNSTVKAIIPGHVMGEMSRIMDDSEDAMLTFHMDGSHLMAIIGNTTMLTSLLAGEYINYRQILPEKWLTRITVKRNELSDAIERASLMAREGKNNLVRMKASGDVLQITSMSEIGDVLEELSVHLEGEEIEIAFNARYISDVIKNIDDECCMLSMNTNVSPCVVSPVEGDEYLYLVLPVRVAN